MLFPIASFAVDGVLEINQACINAGCFPGDAAGFPITINNPGSYRLTSNIGIRSYNSPENIFVIQVISSNVSLDLNGFAVIGDTTCTDGSFKDSPVTSCLPKGVGVGIGVPVISATGISISNGFIQGMGDHGLWFGEAGCRVSNMVVSENGSYGLLGGNKGLFLNNISSRNGEGGFSVSGTLIGNSARANRTFGIQSFRGHLNNNIVNAMVVLGLSAPPVPFQIV